MATALKDSFPFDIARELAAAVSRHEPSSGPARVGTTSN